MSGPALTNAELDALLTGSRLLPLAEVDDPALAVPLAETLVSAGIDVVEIALRTPRALDAIAAAATQTSITVGAGTVRSVADLDAALAAGAQFVVTPGLHPEVSAAAAAAGIGLLPGVLTPTEVLAARSAGHAVVKLFPAGAFGGPALVDALAGPFPDVRFVPTGGVGRADAPAYLGRSSVAAVGGSWMTPRDRIAAADWSAIRTLAERTRAEIA